MGLMFVHEGFEYFATSQNCGSMFNILLL